MRSLTFFTPFAGLKKDEYLWSFHEVVHRLLIRHLLQLVVRLKLRLFVVVVVSLLLPETGLQQC